MTVSPVFLTREKYQHSVGLYSALLLTTAAFCRVTRKSVRTFDDWQRHRALLVLAEMGTAE